MYITPDNGEHTLCGADGHEAHADGNTEKYPVHLDFKSRGLLSGSGEKINHLKTPDRSAYAESDGAEIGCKGHVFGNVGSEAAEDGYFQMAVFLGRIAATDIDGPDEEVAGQFFRPVQRTLQDVAHEDLNCDDQGHACETGR